MLAQSYVEFWQPLLDRLLDSEALVVAAAAAAAARLLEAAASAASGTASQDVLIRRLGVRSARRIATALGPILEACTTVPAPAQVGAQQLTLDSSPLS